MKSPSNYTKEVGGIVSTMSRYTRTLLEPPVGLPPVDSQNIIVNPVYNFIYHQNPNLPPLGNNNLLPPQANVIHQAIGNYVAHQNGPHGNYLVNQVAQAQFNGLLPHMNNHVFVNQLPIVNNGQINLVNAIVQGKKCFFVIYNC
jgi:hypothetical protein